MADEKQQQQAPPQRPRPGGPPPAGGEGGGGQPMPDPGDKQQFKASVEDIAKAVQVAMKTIIKTCTPDPGELRGMANSIVMSLKAAEKQAEEDAKKEAAGGGDKPGTGGGKPGGVGPGDKK